MTEAHAIDVARWITKLVYGGITTINEDDQTYNIQGGQVVWATEYVADGDPYFNPYINVKPLQVWDPYARYPQVTSNLVDPAGDLVQLDRLPHNTLEMRALVLLSVVTHGADGSLQVYMP